MFSVVLSMIFKLKTIPLKRYQLITRNVSFSQYNKMSAPIFLSEDRVKELLDWDSLYIAVLQSMKATSLQKTNQPGRTIASVSNTPNLLYCMPGYLEDDKYGSLACKLVTYWPNNDKVRLPTIQANIMLFNETNGQLDAVSIYQYLN